jgi:iron complex outermembrane receptor protein
MRFTTSVAAAVLITCWSTPTFGQQKPLAGMSLEDLMRIEVAPVFGASKRLQPVTEAPASITIVTADEIRRYGYRTLADVLRGVRGLYVTSDRNYDYVGVRGFLRPGDYDTRVLLLVNGHRMNDSIFQQASIGFDFGLDPSIFERVEIIRGPASSLYGTSAIFAVVNVITKTGTSLNGGVVGVEGGSGNTWGTHVAMGRRFKNGVDAMVSATGVRTAGEKQLFFPEFNSPESNNGVAVSADSERARQMFASVKFGAVTFTGAYADRPKTVPTAAFGTVFNDTRFQTMDRRAFFDAQVDHPAGRMRMTGRAYVDYYGYRGTYPYSNNPGAPEATYLNHDFGLGTWWGLEGRATRPLPGHQSLTFGGEFHDNRSQHQGSWGGDDPLANWDLNRSARDGGIFAQDDVHIGSHVILNGGARFDAYGGYSRLTPRAALIVNSSPNQAFKVLYGRAFRAPNAYELDYYSHQQRNETLRPERVRTTELVWERYQGRALRTSVSAYWNDIDQLISLVDNPNATGDFDTLLFKNEGHVTARGLELEAEVRLASGVQGTASYAFQHARDVATGEQLTNSPHHLAKFRLSLPGPSRGFFSLEANAIGRRITLAGSTVAPVALVNATWTAPVSAALDFSASVRNVFNARYADPASNEHVEAAIPQRGRTVVASLRWRK